MEVQQPVKRKKKKPNLTKIAERKAKLWARMEREKREDIIKKYEARRKSN